MMIPVLESGATSRKKSTIWSSVISET